MKLKYYLLSLSLLSVFLFKSAYALPTDQKQELIITAATGSMNINKGINIVEDNVKVVQGTSQLLADKLIVYSDKDHHVTHVTAIGKPAKYQTLPEQDKPEFYADAGTIDYYPDKYLITLVGNARVHQGEDSMTGPHIEYNTEQQVVTTPRSKQGNTTIIIQPRSSSK